MATPTFSKPTSATFARSSTCLSKPKPESKPFLESATDWFPRHSSALRLFSPHLRRHRCAVYSARMRLFRGVCSTSARPSASNSGGRYIPKRPRRPFFRPYQPPPLEELRLAEVEHTPRNNRMRGL